MDAIISAADMGFTGSLVGSSMLAAYMGTITELTMFLMSMPSEQRSFLLLCEPPHWCRRPNASWMSSSCLHSSSPATLWQTDNSDKAGTETEANADAVRLQYIPLALKPGPVDQK
uniref:Uncharacterized protein n=1 Tax=Esox lucius TaxID=8010 RepID=A0A3P8Y5D4_ESOLU